MVKKVRVSREGLTRCPACAAHIKVAEQLRDTLCPFCGASILAADENTVADEGVVATALRKTAKALMTGRSSIIAASLFGATAMGCGDEATTTTTGADQDVIETSSTDTGTGTGTGTETGTEATGTEVTGETTDPPDPASDYGGPGFEEDTVDTGFAPDVVESDAQTTTGGDVPDIEEDTAPPGEGAADYGGPGFDDGDDGGTTDADVVQEDAPEPTPQPEYGVPAPDAE